MCEHQKLFDYEKCLTGTPAALHFHKPALPGANASAIVTLTITTATVSGGASGEVTLTEPQELDMLAGNGIGTFIPQPILVARSEARCSQQNKVSAT